MESVKKPWLRGSRPFSLIAAVFLVSCVLFLVRGLRGVGGQRVAELESQHVVSTSGYQPRSLEEAGGAVAKRREGGGDPVDEWKILESRGLTGLALFAAQEELVGRATRENGIDVTCSLINLMKGRGADRDRLIEVAFAYSRSGTPELLLAMESYESASERRAAGNALATSSDFDIAAFTSVDSFSVELQTLFANRLSTDVSTSLDKSAVAMHHLKLISDSVRDGKIPRTLLDSWLAQVSIDSPFVAWELRDSASKEKLGGLSAKIIGNMVQADPVKAIEMVVASGCDNWLVDNALREWLKRDRDAAAIWIEQGSNAGSGIQANRMKAVLAGETAKAGQLGDARRMAQEIADPEARAISEGWIWSAERDQLRKEVTGKPSETVQAIVNGSSIFDSYWLEEAVHTWVSKDFDSANAWYEKNWDSLPKEKAQYVAAGFATQAIGQGDVDTARQWAAMIQDGKTKARIEANIAKAASSER